MSERPVLILPIQEEFANAILDGRKPFEFRKIIGEHNPILVLLYVREKSAIVGGFLPGKILRGSPKEVWEATSGRGTTPERFQQYFEDQDRAVALQVRRFERLSPPITEDEITTCGLVIPPNFNVVYTNVSLLNIVRSRGVLLREVERFSRIPGLDFYGQLGLREFTSADVDWFVDLATAEIGKWYDEIDRGFAEKIVADQGSERDPVGLLTRRKRIHVFQSGNERVGFSVATEKLGGSVKFGPTVFESRFQARGYAVLGRKLLEDVYRGSGFRKSYSTIPDSHTEALKYLLKAGYRVEAHLRAHYSLEHGEFVFGKTLRRSKVNVPHLPGSRDAGEIAIASAPPSLAALKDFVSSVMSQFYHELDDKFIEALTSANPDLPQEQKPRECLFAISEKVLGCCVVVKKRGGAVKLAPFVTVNDPDVIRLLIEEAERTARRIFTARKIYTLTPVALGSMTNVLETMEFEIEGMLSAPYKPGIDMFVSSKFPKKGAAE